MNFKLLSFNVRGLNEDSSIPILRNYISSIPVLDVLCVQEHKLRGAAVDQLGRKLWPQAKCWSIEATPGYTLQVHSTGKGGIATLLAPRWAALVSSSGTLLDNRAH
jgi:exonuclease III